MKRPGSDLQKEEEKEGWKGRMGSLGKWHRGEDVEEGTESDSEKKVAGDTCVQLCPFLSCCLHHLLGIREAVLTRSPHTLVINYL